MPTRNINAVLHDIQVALKAPKDQWNDFGKYQYRTAESIIQSVKPLLPDGYTVVVDIEPQLMEGRIVCMVEARLVSGDNAVISAKAYAVEPEGKKGMDSAQVSGATISYAKKYALGNLFAIDGNKDSDAPETPSNGSNGKKASNGRKKAATPSQGDTAPLVMDVNEEHVKAAKKALFLAMQGYANRTGRDVNEIVAETFAEKDPDDWTVQELDALASKLSKEAR